MAKRCPGCGRFLARTPLKKVTCSRRCYYKVNRKKLLTYARQDYIKNRARYVEHAAAYKKWLRVNKPEQWREIRRRNKRRWRLNNPEKWRAMRRRQEQSRLKRRAIEQKFVQAKIIFTTLRRRAK